MKMRLLVSIVAVSPLLVLHSAFGQGALTPPGPPGPTMVALSQLEPRTPISSAPFTITQAGSYYLTANVIIGVSGPAISIMANNTTFDLNGFSISSTNPSAGGTAILLGSGVHNIAILNGAIDSGVTNNGSGVYSGTGFAFGIDYHINPPFNVRVHGILVKGCLNNGISLGLDDLSIVESCTVQTAGNFGVEASVVKDVTAIDCGNNAITAGTVSDCFGQTMGFGYGIEALTVFNSYGVTTNEAGIVGTTAENCYGISYNGDGIQVNQVINCYGVSYGYGGGAGFTGTGVYANSAHNCTGYTYCANGTGIYAEDAQSCFCISYNTNGIGLDCQTCENCYGEDSGGGGTGVQAGAALNCIGASTTGTGLSAFVATGCYSGP